MYNKICDTCRYSRNIEKDYKQNPNLVCSKGYDMYTPENRMVKASERNKDLNCEDHEFAILWSVPGLSPIMVFFFVVMTSVIANIIIEVFKRKLL